MGRKSSEDLFLRAKKHLVGGVNSPVRAYRDFDFAPPFITKAKGAHVWDADGNEYIDYVGSWGPMILGHAHEKVVEAIKDAAEKGTSYGAPTEKETELAELVKDAFPSIDLLRFVSSGTEATMSAIRVARGFTGREKIIKFNGCYHGHSDYLLVKAGSGLATFSEPDSKGVPEDFAKHTLIADFNDITSVEKIVEANKGEIAAIIVEPIAGNMGCVPPSSVILGLDPRIHNKSDVNSTEQMNFLQALRKICDQNNILLIFDEVITGFRVAFGGAQELYGVKPDLTCLGKILGGGLPMGAYGGKKEMMEMLSPLGPVYQAGTLSGNPLAVSAGIATLNVLKQGRHCKRRPAPYGAGRSGAISNITSNEQLATSNFYDFLDSKTDDLTKGISEILIAKDIPHKINRVGSMFSIFFNDRKTFDRFFIHMLNNGIYFAPSPFESAFVSLSHSKDDIEKTLSAVKSM